MEDIRSVLDSHHTKDGGNFKESQHFDVASHSEIPDVFFDEILVEYKLSRIETLCLMYLYRRVWCRPNLHRKYGIGPILDLREVSAQMDTSGEELLNALRMLEGHGFIETIRSGQYFVRKFFTEANDRRFGQHYDHFF